MHWATNAADNGLHFIATAQKSDYARHPYATGGSGLIREIERWHFRADGFGQSERRSHRRMARSSAASPFLELT
jgi:hypothetical protein